jgi:uncharacterized protein (DUF697 family)
MSDPTNQSEVGTALEEVSGTTRKADAAVRNHAVGSAVVGAIPVGPLVMVILLALNLKMVHKLSRIYGVDFNEDLGRAAIYSFIGACGAGAIGGRVIFGLSTLVPVAGQFIQAVTVPVFAAGFTYGIGKLFTQHFAAGGTFLDFHPEEVREHFYAEFQKGTKLAAKA